MSSIAHATLQSNAPGYALFDANAVAAATLLGTPVAGASLMALNYRHLGQGMKAVSTLLMGLVITALAILVGWNLPHAASAPIALVLLIGIRKMAEVTQGSAVKEQLREGGRLGSKWIAFLVGVGFLAVLFAVIYFANLVPGFGESKVIIGAKDEVFYSGSATKEQALALGNKLKAVGYLTDRGVTVFFDQEPNARILSFVAKEGTWTQPALVSSFEDIARQAAPSIGGFPVQVRLMDKHREVKANVVVGKVDSGNDSVYYLGTATQGEAQALTKELKSKGFFQGRGADVFLSKDKDGFALSFVVQDGIADKPAVVSEFETTVRETASAVGGLPIKLRLLNTSLEVKKEQWVR